MTDGVYERLQGSVPAGLVEELSGDPRVIRSAEVARGRLRAVDRCFDRGEVVEEIATQLLLLSATG